MSIENGSILPLRPDESPVIAPGTGRFFYWVMGFGVLLGSVLLSAANLWWGDLNQDEGWYLYAARLVSQGILPYRDFAFTQGPVMPTVYSWVQPWLAQGGVAAGRGFTAILGLLAACATAALVGRLTPAPRRAAATLIAFTLIGLNVYQSYFFTVVKTYSLTALFLMSGFWLLSVALERRTAPAMLLAGAVMALAVATRSSAVVAPGISALILWGPGRRLWPAAGWLFALGAVLMGLLVFLPFFILDPEAFWFCVVKYHTARSAGGFFPALVYKAGFVSRLVQAYFVAFGFCAAALIWLGADRWLKGQGGESGRLASAAKPSPDSRAWPVRFGMDSIRALLCWMLWLSVAGVTALHASAPFPYDDYQVFVFPLFVAGLTLLLTQRVGERMLPWLTLTAVLLSAASAVSSPINQDWFIQGRDRIWWRMKDCPPLKKLQTTAAYLRTLAGPDELLLTQDPYLAVESGLVLPRGLEMGQFSYFPGLTDAQARHLHVFNRRGLERLLNTCPASVAALSGYAFAMRSPEVEPVPPADEAAFRAQVDRRYARVRQVPYFGQAATTLEIYQRRPQTNPSHHVNVDTKEKTP